ncbi:vicilin-like seed storage protein At2g28490 [Primulina huaijiensis]|uniref:vicilin-like seed storage protein At2g28490 n=1 Tax=Primulina huaijiensis TaxID=1492673 RepID=UPI003CC77969
MMGKRIDWEALFLLVVMAAATAVAAAGGGVDVEDEGWWREGGSDWFLLKDSKHVVKTDAGEMKVVRGVRGKSITNPMHIGFITMEPRSLFIPQYLDSSLIIFLRAGEARVGHIYKDKLVERTLKMGDIYRIEAGSAFYVINTDHSHSLHMICSIDAFESLHWHTIQSFFIAGGTYPTSVLSGFEPSTLSAAFNVSEAELSEMLTRQKHGPIVHLSDNSHSWSKFLDMKRHEKLARMRKIVGIKEEDVEEEGSTWCSFKEMLVSMLAKADKRQDDGWSKTGRGPGSCNIYERKADFKNNYGWSVSLDESDYSPLKHSDTGVYLVSLTKGSMMAPHINPRATEYGIVLQGSGTIQIVFPNGSLAMNSNVSQGDVFWIPRYFPFCQIASRTAQFEFFGFTTSARNNRPQFLAGANSMLNAMKGPEFAASFGMSSSRFKRIIDAQRESAILPAWPSTTSSAEVEVEAGGFGDEILDLEFD